MKIAIICLDRPDLSPHGIERGAWCYGREMALLGHQVSVIYHRGEGKRPRLKNLCFCQVKVFEASKELESRNDWDIIALFGPAVLPLAYFIHQNRNKVVFHTPVPIYQEFKSYFKSMISGLPRTVPLFLHYFSLLFFEMLFLRYVSLIVVPTERVAESFFRLFYRGRAKIAVVPYGQDIRRQYFLKAKEKISFYRQKFKNRKILLFIGSNWERKNIRSLLLALPKLKERIDYLLVVISPPNKEYFPMMEKLEVMDRIFITGFVTDLELSALYSVADVFILPSYHEALSQTVLEAMAFGKPVIVSEIAGYPVVKNGVNGFIVDCSQPTKIALAILNLLENNKLYARLSSQAFIIAGEYTWTKCVGKLEKVYLNFQKKE